MRRDLTPFPPGVLSIAALLPQLILHLYQFIMAWPDYGGLRVEPAVIMDGEELCRLLHMIIGGRELY